MNQRKSQQAVQNFFLLVCFNGFYYRSSDVFVRLSKTVQKASCKLINSRLYKIRHLV